MRAKCSVTDCERPVHGHGMCRLHWRHWKQHGDPLGGRRNVWGGTLEERLWHRVNKAGPVPEHVPDLGPCWLWQGADNGHGYGIIGEWADGKVRMVYTHRLSYELAHGPIPEGFDVCHRCDNPPCCNPDHLMAAPHIENERDKAVKGRTVRGEAQSGAKLTYQTAATIRARAASGEPQKALASEFGVSPMTVSRVVRGQIWRAD